MDSERLRRISDVVNEVVEIPPGPGRDQRLLELGADDPALGSEVCSLLAVEAGLTAPDTQADRHAGLRLGSYEIGPLVARGGMASRRRASADEGRHGAAQLGHLIMERHSSRGIQMFTKGRGEPSVMTSRRCIRTLTAAIPAFAALLHLGAPLARAQAPYQLVPALTDQSPVTVSDLQGVPAAHVANDAGDVAWLGQRFSAVFYRRAGTPQAIRVLQLGDEVAGLPGSRVLNVFTPLLMNSAGLIAFRADVLTTSRITNAIFTFDGTTLQVIATGADTAPGTGGKKFERAMTLFDLNSSGDLLFGSTLVPNGSSVAAEPTVFLKTAGGGISRIAGPGTAAPSTGGTFTAANGSALSDTGQALFSASISGGSSATAIFAWKGGTIRKIVAQGDTNPLGGTFTDDMTTRVMRQSADGTVFFFAANSLWYNTEANGTSVGVAVGSAAPAPVNGTFNGTQVIQAFSPAGDVVYQANVSGGASASAIFRFRPGVPVEAVVRLNQSAPGLANSFTGYGSFSVNSAGTVTFEGNQSGAILGLFQKPAGGALSLFVPNAVATPVGGTLFLFSHPTQTLVDGSVIIRAAIYNSATYYAMFRWSGSPTTLMSTSDYLPFGGRVVVRPTFVSASGDWVGVSTQRAGGRESVGVFNVATQQLQFVATEGDVVPNTGGGLVNFSNLTSVQVNSVGDVLAPVNIWGGTSSLRFGLYAGGVGHTAGKLVAGGDVDTQGRVLGQPQSHGGARPFLINSSGTAAFSALVNGGARGMFAGSVGSTPVKVAIVGDVVSTGQAITSINATPGGINELGQVLFTANTASGAGLYVATPGQVPQKIAAVGDVAPGGGTFAAFGTPHLNNVGQVAFMATTTGGPGGGVYLGSTGGAPVAIALNGAVSPAGSTFLLTVLRPDALVNDLGDVAFRGDLGASPFSAIFIKRAASALTALAISGQPAPGTSGIFMYFRGAPNGQQHETHDISNTGAVVFFGQVVTPSNEFIVGWWHVDPLGAIQPVQYAASTDPAFDGGTASSTASMLNWLSGDRLVTNVPMANAPYATSLFLYAPRTSSSTNVGANVQVTPTDSATGATATVTFSTVTSPGTTTLSRAAGGPALPRGWYRATGLSSYYNIATTATFTGSITVCLDFSDHDIPAGAVLRLLHFENSAWVDVTSGPPVGSTICGVATSLSPFVVAQALNTPTSNLVQNGDFSNGATSWSAFDGTMVWTVNGGVFEYLASRQQRGRPATHGRGGGRRRTARGDLGDGQLEQRTEAVQRPDPQRLRVRRHAPRPVRLHVLPAAELPAAHVHDAARTPTSRGRAPPSRSMPRAATAAAGRYQLDNVVMGPGHELTAHRTDCLDPLAPAADDVPDGQPLLANGGFATNDLTSWGTANTITTQVTTGVAQFIRPSVLPSGASGVLFQVTGVPVAANQIVSARFRMGNSSNVRKRVTILLHALAFNDLAACTFWLEPNQALSTYTMRTWVSQAWANAMISFYPATTDSLQWYELDDVSMSVTPGAPTYGTDCVEPTDESGLSGGLPFAAPVPAALPLDRQIPPAGAAAGPFRPRPRYVTVQRRRRAASS